MSDVKRAVDVPKISVGSPALLSPKMEDHLLRKLASRESEPWRLEFRLKINIILADKTELIHTPFYYY